MPVFSFTSTANGLFCTIEMRDVFDTNATLASVGLIHEDELWVK